MSPSTMRRLICLVSVVLFAWAALVVPGLVAPERMERLCDRVFPEKVAEHLKETLLPNEHGPSTVNRGWIERAFELNSDDSVESANTMKTFSPILAFVTGEKSQLDLGGNIDREANQWSLLVTLVPADCDRLGGLAVLRSGSCEVAVVEGQCLLRGSVRVVRIRKDKVVLDLGGREETISLVGSDRKKLM